MKHRWKRIAVSCLMMLALVATLGLGCGDDEEEEGKVTITIGHISDMTGPAATAFGARPASSAWARPSSPGSFATGSTAA